MGNSSSSPSQIISLPKGGGAQHGLGEKFSPDLHTGTGNFTVPIALPPGRNGFQPQLNHPYSTGPFGLSWRLGIPGLGRKTGKGNPRYQDYHKELKATPERKGLGSGLVMDSAEKPLRIFFFFSGWAVGG